MHSQTEEAIGQLIATTIKEMNSGMISAHTSDNCKAMIKAGEHASRVLGRTIMRIPCGSHILNLALLGSVKDPCISRVWNKRVDLLLSDE